MRYLGIDVHVETTVWCLLNEQGEIVSQGKDPTTTVGLGSMVARVGGTEDLVAGQEVGTMAFFVYDTLTSLGVKVLSFNAHHLRMIAASRKKTDRRDAYWLAKALQTGMTPHPVYIPTREVRGLRRLLSRRAAIVCCRAGLRLSKSDGGGCSGLGPISTLRESSPAFTGQSRSSWTRRCSAVPWGSTRISTRL
jgi:hypothetical protein